MYAVTSATAASSHRAASEPHTHDTAPARAPAINDPPTWPSTVSREFVRTRSSAGGRTCGVIDALTTPKVLDSTSIPSARGYSSQESKLSARITASTARRVKVNDTVRRRPLRSRSRAGPITGAISANGATVTRRYRATLLRDSAVAAEKNNVLARATARIASHAKLATVT